MNGGGLRIAQTVVKILLSALVCYGAIVAAMFLAQRALLYPGANGRPAPAASWGEPASIDTPDGQTLFALHAQAAPGRPTVLLFHGNADRVDAYGFLASALGKQGVGLLAVSYRGYAGSTGTPSETGLLIDGLAAFDWLATRSDSPVVVLGRSLGSGVGVHVAAERDAAGLILVSAYDSILAVAQRAYFLLPVGPLIRDSFRSDLRIARVAAPKLFLHGRRDEVIPLAHGEALYAASREPKRMAVIDGVGHNDIWDGAMVAEIVNFVVTEGSR